MHAHKKSAVPDEIALLYGFVNSLDLRAFAEQGVPHVAGDKLATAAELKAWLCDHGLLDKRAKLGASDHRKAMDLREALRSFLQLAPADRAANAAVARQLNAAATHFPMALNVARGGEIALRSSLASPTSGLVRVLAEFHRLAETEQLDRMKMCASDECHWIFYDRSKPGNRRWCSSTICGNREKTRNYRGRRKQAGT
jgi:predicted RNA-binding Zn ribbon-like protein